MEQPTCKTCRFYLRDYTEETGLGLCRRFPPIATPGIQVARGCVAAWPSTCDDDWCGEHKPAETLCTTTLEAT